MISNTSLIHNSTEPWRSRNLHRSQPTTMKNTLLPATTRPCHSKDMVSSCWNEWSLTRKRSKQNLMDTNEIDPIIQEHMTIISCYSQTTSRLSQMDTNTSSSGQADEVIQHTPMTPRHSQRRLYPRPSSYESISPQFLRAEKSRRLNSQLDGSMNRYNHDTGNSSIQFWNHLSAITGNSHMKPYKLTH